MYPHSTQSSLLKCEACSGAGYGLARECLPLDPSLPQPMGCGVHRGPCIPSFTRFSRYCGQNAELIRIMIFWADSLQEIWHWRLGSWQNKLSSRYNWNRDLVSNTHKKNSQFYLVSKINLKFIYGRCCVCVS